MRWVCVLYLIHLYYSLARYRPGGERQNIPALRMSQEPKNGCWLLCRKKCKYVCVSVLDFPALLDSASPSCRERQGSWLDLVWTLGVIFRYRVLFRRRKVRHCAIMFALGEVWGCGIGGWMVKGTWIRDDVMEVWSMMRLKEDLDNLNHCFYRGFGWRIMWYGASGLRHAMEFPRMILCSGKFGYSFVKMGFMRLSRLAFSQYRRRNFHCPTET